MIKRSGFQMYKGSLFCGVLTVIFLLVASIGSKAQLTTRKDTTIILLSSVSVQLECTQALNDLYSFNICGRVTAGIRCPIF
jgi:hypothetical protein